MMTLIMIMSQNIFIIDGANNRGKRRQIVNLVRKYSTLNNSLSNLSKRKASKLSKLLIR